MDRRTLLAISLSFLIFFGWQKYYLEPRSHQSAPQGVVAGLQAPGAEPVITGVTPTATAGGKSATPSAPPTRHAPQTLAIPNGTGAAILGDGAPFFTGWDLKSYRLGISDKAAAVDLDSVTNRKGEVELAFDDPAFAYLTDVQGSLRATPSGAEWTYEDAQIKISRVLRSSDDQNYVDVNISAEFKQKKPAFAFVSLTSQHRENDPEEQDRQLIYWQKDSVERIHVKGDISLKEAPSGTKYVAATNRYFVLALLSQAPWEPRGLIQPLGPGAARASLVFPVTGNSVNIPLKVYFGPKELGLLRSVDPSLDHVVDFGWFTLFAYPLLKLLKWFYAFVQNYGVAIILLTILLKVLTFPLTYKSMKSMKEMAKIQPQLTRLKEKHKDDREALNREMMSLMRSHGYNPMAGCLPMIIQMPVFFALYRVLYGSIELYHAPFGMWIHDLSAKDPYYVTPVLLSLTMFIQQRLTPNTATDPAQKRMMQMMPLIFGAFMLALPSGLTLYMLVNALASIVQQLILNKKLDAKK
jgi:YidC/Oxa1 family membrane protein insertase